MSSFTLELEISFSKKLLTTYKSDPKLEPGNARTLEKKLDTAIVICNTAKGEALKRLHNYSTTVLISSFKRNMLQGKRKIRKQMSLISHQNIGNV